MPITVNDFDSLTDDLQSIFNEVARTKVSENVGFKVFDVMDTDRRTFDHLLLHGLEGIKRVTPGQDLPKITGQEGDTISFTQEYFGGDVEITKEMRKFDLHNQIESITRSASADAFDKVDQSLADRLVQGWDTTYTDVYGDTVSATGPDGKALFDSAHDSPSGSNTFSNVITDGTNTNPSLSRDAITHMRQNVGMVFTDPNGITRPINLDTLIVPPSLTDLAMRLVKTERIPGSANNDINPVNGWIKNIIEWPRLQTASDGTDASAYWFMADSSKLPEALKALFAEKPTLDAPEQVYRNKNWEYTLDFFYVIGTGYPAYVAGSKGDES